VAGTYLVTPPPVTQMIEVTKTVTASPILTTATVPAIKEVTIADVEPLSGEYAPIAVDSQRGMDLALENINATGGIKSLGGAKINLIYADCKSDPVITKSETERAISVYKPAIVIGSYISRLTWVSMETAAKYDQPFLIYACDNDLTNPGYEYAWRQCITFKEYATAGLNYLHDIAEKRKDPIKTMAYVYENSVFGVKLADDGKKLAEGWGWESVLDEPYPSSATDLTPVVSKMLAAKPDGVYLLSYHADSVVMARAIKELGFKPKAFVGAAGTGYCMPEFIEALREDANYYCNAVGYNPTGSKPYNQWFVEEYTKRYGRTPSESAGYGAATMWTVKEFLETAGRLHPDNPLDKDSIRDAVFNTYVDSGPLYEIHGKLKISKTKPYENEYRMGLVIQVIDQKVYTVYPFDLADREAVYPIPK